MTDVKIKSGYCFETDAIEPPDYAVQKRDERGLRHHYFCTSTGCAMPLTPAHWHETGLAWYRTDGNKPDQKHVFSCDYRILEGVGASLRSNQVSSRPDLKHRVIVPNVLGHNIIQQNNIWPEQAPPSRIRLAALAAKAQELVIPGDLEDVVTAHERIKGERVDYALNIGGKVTNYRDGFPWFWNLDQPWKSQAWRQNIVTAYCKVKSGNRPGIWFVNVLPSSKGKYAGSGLSLGLMVRRSDLEADPKKKLYEPFLAAAAITKRTVKLYWQGGGPSAGPYGFNLSGPAPISARFALRHLVP